MHGFAFNAVKLEAKNNQYFIVTQYFPTSSSTSYTDAPNLALYFGNTEDDYVHLSLP